ncbi:YdeI/OmpD-associated family protein [Flagellimonas sp.]|uniref:YdeI/OmpD-associated family protein n=1 Tax=Flagellimonas sp. TaxID=2058762 RepID=UPI003B52F3CE
METLKTKYFTDRKTWRKWLEANFDKVDDIWLEYPKKQSGKARISYNDAVEEALCFGWIDSTVKSLNPETTIQRFCKRRAKSSFSQPNKERLMWLLKEDLVHPSIKSDMQAVVAQTFVFPEDLLAKIKTDKLAWVNYQNFSESYKRIRIAYIESARKRPDEFEKRLQNFIAKTRENKLVRGFGGIEKYY